MQEPFKFCSACGAQNQLGAQFCQRCGASYDGASPPARAQPTGARLSTVLIVFVVLVFGCIGVSMVASLLRPDKTPSPKEVGLAASLTPTRTPANPKDDSDYEKVVYNELGKMTIKSSGGSVTSIRLDATSQDQKESLQAMLLYLEVSHLTAQRACSLTLTYGSWKDRGEIHNCAGDRVGALNAEAVGFMRDKVDAALQRGN